MSLPFAHWYHLIEGLQESTQKFYKELERVIKTKQIKGLEVSRTDYREGGILSAKREYLRVRWHDYIFDVCAAPFGNGFFISWWLGEKVNYFQSLIMMIPYLGGIIIRLFKPVNFYVIDTSLMFQEFIHSAVLEVLDQTTNASGLRALSESERKPIMQKIFR